MRRSRVVFAGWLVAFLAFFFVANLAGVIRSIGLKPFRYTGFPFTFAAWGMGIEEFFDWQLLAWNGLIALAVSGLGAWGCAWWRYFSPRPSPQKEKKRNQGF